MSESFQHQNLDCLIQVCILQKKNQRKNSIKKSCEIKFSINNILKTKNYGSTKLGKTLN